MAIDGDNGTSTVGGGNTGYNWSGYAEWLAKTKNSTKTCNLIVNYYANGYNGSAAENPPPSSVRSYTGQSVDVRLVVEVASGDTMSNPGYVFVGWATSNNTPTVTYNPGDTISNSWAADYRGNSVTNLYAVWTNQNVITYNPDDNSIEKSAIYQVKQSGQSATLKGATFTRTGYTQTGWATTAGGPKVYDLSGTYSSNNPLSLYPVWQANTYTITYVANEGTGTMADQTVTYDSTFTPRACSFIREGYSFSSWNESQDGKGIRWKVQEYTVDRAENITLYAIWKGNEYTVYYDDNYSRYSDEITGDIVTFESEYAQPLKKAEVSFSPIQDLHGYANPWPAGGGKNKLPPLAGLQNYKSLNSSWTWNDNVATVNGITLEVIQKDGIPTGTYKITGTATANTNFYLLRADATPYAGMIMNGIPAGTVGRWEMYCALQVSPYTSWGYDTGNGVTLNSSASGMSLIILRLKNNGQFDDVFTPMIRLATEADATFAPYSNICPISGRTGLSVYVGPTQDQQDAITYAVDWTTEAGTVYHGTVDPVTGQLTVDWASVDMGSLSWSRNATYNVMYAYVAGKANGRGNLICSNYKTVELYYEYLSSGEISGALNNNAINVKDDAYTSAANFKAAMSGVQLVYELATPLTYQLSAQEIEALVGTNNVWSDGGPITIVYALDEVPQNMPPSTAIFGDIFYTRRNQLSRFGLTFKGWNTVPDGSGEAWLPSGVSMGTYKRTEDAVWNVSHNVTLYAQWDPNVYPFGTVFFNGRNAQDLGIIVEELPSYYYAERAFNHKQVNGKNGDVILDTGRYENVKKVYKVACYDPSRNFYESAVALSTFLHSAGSDYIRLEDSYEPSSYRMAIYEETNEIENLLGKAGRCEITFNCMPQRFLLSGDEEITIPSSGYSIYNPTAFDAKPMIRIQGTGTVTINGRSVQVTENDNDMLVDCENQNAKDLSGADMNYFIYCDEFPILKPGFNTISYTETIDAVKITPRWWIL